MTSKHHPACLKHHHEVLVHNSRYIESYPNYCRKCNGHGVLCYTFDPSPQGISLSPGTMQDCDPCPECSEKGLCPRCGKETLTEATEWSYCTACSWMEGDPGFRDDWDCYCWEAELAKLPDYPVINDYELGAYILNQTEKENRND